MKYLAVLPVFEEFNLKECKTKEEAQRIIDQWTEGLKKSYPNKDWPGKIYFTFDYQKGGEE